MDRTCKMCKHSQDGSFRLKDNGDIALPCRPCFDSGAEGGAGWSPLVDPSAPPSKLCTRCREMKPLTDFYLMTNSPDGHQCWCKVCHSSGRIPTPRVVAPKPPGMRFCRRCGETKTTALFPSDRNSKDGLYSLCKSCKNKPNSTREVTGGRSPKPSSEKDGRVLVSLDEDCPKTDLNLCISLEFLAPKVCKV